MAPWRLNTITTDFRELYPAYEATARVFAQLGVPPDFETDGPIRFTHRHKEQMDIYFVANQTPETAETTCTFRVNGRQPELWDPLTGAMRDLPEYAERDGRLVVPLHFEPHQSFFVVFREKPSIVRSPTPQQDNFLPLHQVAEIRGPWDLSFDTSLAGPDRVCFQTLEDWSKRDEPGIKYFSGIAKYKKTFDLPETVSGARRILLDLGSIHNMAQVQLNGRDLGVLWCAPWRVDITDTVQAKGNCLEIEVANLWPNRLIGDKALPPEQQVTWTTWNPYKADSPLLPSGLLGPVTIQKEVLAGRPNE